MNRRKTVLVVDDSQAIIDALSGAFEDAGYTVATAMDGEEVFRKMASVNPDAILLDIYMPRLNGADVCRVVKSHPQWKKSFLVLMSSRLSQSELEMYRRIGADQLLKKPFEPGAALAMVTLGIGSASSTG